MGGTRHYIAEYKALTLNSPNLVMGFDFMAQSYFGVRGLDYAP